MEIGKMAHIWCPKAIRIQVSKNVHFNIGTFKKIYVICDQLAACGSLLKKQTNLKVMQNLQTFFFTFIEPVYKMQLNTVCLFIYTFS